MKGRDGIDALGKFLVLYRGWYVGIKQPILGNKRYFMWIEVYQQNNQITSRSCCLNEKERTNFSKNGFLRLGKLLFKPL